MMLDLEEEKRRTPLRTRYEEEVEEDEEEEATEGRTSCSRRRACLGVHCMQIAYLFSPSLSLPPSSSFLFLYGASFAHATRKKVRKMVPAPKRQTIPPPALSICATRSSFKDALGQTSHLTYLFTTSVCSTREYHVDCS
ncbi:hypothetical protein LSTR_LSTR014730 [Laodelphax striatellus]|uniref:Uncharacterized protein n=1 Tax=Laodelphax striatellus TaxID=195883 RepID=A0A482XLY6_LAOST|nr:hypothetical protein LSTR_LSTR014730 [Laodelphax striatellus]